MRALGRSLARAAASLLPALLVPAAASGAADPSTPLPAAVLELRDGRVLHNVKVMSSGADGVVVNADEGLVKVPRSNLPDAMAAALPASPAPSGSSDMVMQPFNPNLAQVTPTPGPKPKPSPKPTPAPKPTPNPVFKGCSISGFRAKPFQEVLGAVEVVIQNDTDAPVVIYPADLTCVAASGAQRRGRQFVLEAYPPIIRRHETVPAHGSLDEQVIFSSEAIDLSTVRWSR